MTRKADFFFFFEDFCLKRLSEKEKMEFKVEMLHNDELREETRLHEEIQSAISEKDVLTLRNKLTEIASLYNKSKINATFEILQDLNNLNLPESTNEEVDISKFRDSMPRVHVYQHNKTNGENIHQYYREQNNKKINGSKDAVNGFDSNEFEKFEGLEEALLEEDVMQLRDQLKQVAGSVKLQYPTEKIDDYLNGNLSEKDTKLFEAEITKNKKLEKEVKLYKELAEAIHENDIMNLRETISGIVRRETSWSATDREIEDYIEGNLQATYLERIENELIQNSDLRKEVLLRKQVNESLAEKDILALRKKLGNVEDESKIRDLKSVVPDSKTRLLRFIRNSVAVVVLIICGITFNNFWHNTTGDVYNTNFETPSVGPERSTESDFQLLSEGHSNYSQQEYLKAIPIYLQVIDKNSDDFVARFFLGASYQNINEFNKAINEYGKVIAHGNNQFIEEAEWYRALCYLKIGEKKNARKELLAIENKKGDFSNRASGVLRKMKYLRK